MSSFFALQTIDPASQETVDSVRQEINQQRGESVRQETNQQRGNSRRTMRPREDEINCPICLANVSYALQTNCGHTFCGRLHHRV